MVAAAVLFDCGVASWTLFRVGTYPVGGLGVVFTFLEPSLDENARSGLVVGEGAAETPVITAAAVYGGYDLAELLLLYTTVYGVYAIWRWTPLEVVFVINVRSGEKLGVPVNLLAVRSILVVGLHTCSSNLPSPGHPSS